jgi:NAD(P)-dependent dehydrogenase (short-subunit alcohol dehydrogenase family)
MIRSIDPSAVGAGRGLAGRVAVVTGAGSRGDGIGNGRAAAVLLARQGARLALLDENAGWAERTHAMIEAEGGEAFVVRCDVSRLEDCEAAVAATVARWGRLDVLVNNVGVIGPAGTAVDVDPQAWEAGLRVNLSAMVWMARFAIPRMREQGGGAIVNLSSVAGLQGGYPSLLYPTTKGAVVALTQAMAAQHGPEGIRVNCIAPGMVYTPMVSTRGMSDTLRESRRLGAPLRTEGTGWDIGHAVVYLASDEARWLSGVVLPVDAGASSTMGTLPGVPRPAS